jgi:hypothetical protein
MKFRKTIIAILILLGISSISFIIGMDYGEKKLFNSNSENTRVIIIKNNESRDYDYEWYCDSIFHYDEDYYFDVLMVTEQYNDYIEKHGQWW